MATSADVTLETRYQDLARAFAAGDIVPAGR
jgi:hypothetical protein